MNQNIFLYTLPQWFIFVSIFVTVYGWVENKKPLRLIGMFLLIALGVYAVWAIGQGYFLSNEIENELKAQFTGTLLSAYRSFVISGILAIPALFLDWKNKQLNRLFIILAGLVAILGFLVIANALKSL